METDRQRVAAETPDQMFDGGTVLVRYNGPLPSTWISAIVRWNNLIFRGSKSKRVAAVTAIHEALREEGANAPDFAIPRLRDRIVIRQCDGLILEGAEGLLAARRLGWTVQGEVLYVDDDQTAIPAMPSAFLPAVCIEQPPVDADLRSEPAVEDDKEAAVEPPPPEPAAPNHAIAGSPAPPVAAAEMTFGQFLVQLVQLGHRLVNTVEQGTVDPLVWMPSANNGQRGGAGL